MSSSAEASAAASASSSSVRSVSLAFHPTCSFSTSYQRNNKSNGQKNLRCFPGHCFEGHRSGWCGHPLVVRSQGGKPGMRLVGAFAPKTEDEDGAKPQPRFELGSIVRGTDLDDMLRANLLAECMEAFVEEVPRECDVVRESWEATNRRSAPPENCDREFVFNSKSKGWHYGFLGSKKDSNVWHVWSVFAMDPISESEPDRFRVAARLDSPAFQLFCRRRNRGPLAKARLETSQRVSAVTCKCIYADSTAEEIAQAIPPVAPIEAFMTHAAHSSSSHGASSSGRKSTPRKRTSIDTTTASSASSASSNDSPTPTRKSKKYKPSFSNELDRLASISASTSAINAIVQAADQAAEPDRRFEMVLDLVHRVQLPGSSQAQGGGLAAQARRTTHAALVLVPGQDAAEFGQLALKLAKHWKRMDQRGLPAPVQQAQQFALSAPADDLAPPFASFLLGQGDFAEHVMSLASLTESQGESASVQNLRAAERMLWLMQRQVIAVQRLRSEMRMMAAPPSWPSVSGGGQAPPSPMPSATPFGLPMQAQEMLPSSPLINLPGLPMTPYLMSQLHRRRMGSNTSTGSDPAMMMTDFDLEWFSKSLDTLHADGSSAQPM